MTVEEVHGGVDCSYRREMLDYATNRLNGDIYLLRRPDDREFYYSPTKYIDDPEMPVDQRKRISGLKNRKQSFWGRQYIW